MGILRRMCVLVSASFIRISTVIGPSFLMASLNFSTTLLLDNSTYVHVYFFRLPRITWVLLLISKMPSQSMTHKLNMTAISPFDK